MFSYSLRFPGQYFDVETGTHYNFIRDFDPRIGRYVESDPIGLSGGISTFGYVEGNPLALSDMYGLQALPNQRERPDERPGRERPDPRPMKPGQRSFDIDGEKQYCYARCMQEKNDKNSDTTMKLCTPVFVGAAAGIVISGGKGTFLGVGSCLVCIGAVGGGLTIGSDSACRSDCGMAKGFADRFSDSIGRSRK